MRKLLSAGAVRLWRSKIFWLCCAAMTAMGAIPALMRWREAARFGVYAPIDSVFPQFSVLALILPAVVGAFLIGPEYGDGTMRNKIIAGCGRRDVYLANLLISSLSTLIMCIFAIGGVLAAGIPLLGGFKMGAARAALTGAGICAMALSSTAIATLVHMSIDRRTAAAVTSLVLVLVLLAAGAYIYGRLQAPPELQGYVLSVNGELVESEPQPNPSAVPEGPVRRALSFINDLLPGGQAVQYSDLSAGDPMKLIIFDAAVILAATCGGMAIFKRRDLK